MAVAACGRALLNSPGARFLARNGIGFHGSTSHLLRSASSMVNLQHKNGVAVMELSRKPVNSFSLEFLEEINTTLMDLENNRDCKGLIITSSLPKVFSAGLDLIKELHNANESRLSVFWRRFQEMWLLLYGSRLVTIAAINGHAIAGGCLLASACDFRVMAPNFTIGMNETVAGLAVPWWVAQSVVNVVGYQVGEKACVLGTLFPTEEALKVGLVDRIAPREQIMEDAEKEMGKWLVVPGKARALTKQVLRREFIQKLRTKRDEDVKNFVSYVLLESTQKQLEAQINSIKSKSKK